MDYIHDIIFFNFLELVKTTRVIAGKMHSKSPILKVRGTQQPGNSYISMGTKLHPPYPNQTACLVYEFRYERCSSMLEECGPVDSLDGGRFIFWQSWLIQASRLANLQASALNAGVPNVPNLPLSNCSYVAHI